jgi:hypothetical protein
VIPWELLAALGLFAALQRLALGPQERWPAPRAGPAQQKNRDRAIRGIDMADSGVYGVQVTGEKQGSGVSPSQGTGE